MEYQSIDYRKTPYRGLMPYTEEDARFFFGREKLHKIITANLKGSRLTVLYGSSGVGKSSVLQAGVAYNLRRKSKQNLEEYEAPEFAVVVFNSWRDDDPLDGLVKCVQESVAKAIEGNLDELTRWVQDHIKHQRFPILRKAFLCYPHSEKESLILWFFGFFFPLTLTQTLQAWAELLSGEDFRGKLFIILDQFEEYFLYHPDEEGEGTFFAEFPHAVNRPDVNFLISIREDSLAKLDRFKTRIPSLFDNYLRIRHLDAKLAYEAIVKPIEKYKELVPSEKSISIETDLPKEVIKQVSQVVIGSNGRGGLEKLRPQLEKQIETPYLQLVMIRLWEEETKAGSSCLQLKTFLELGGAEQIVRDHLNKAMELLSEAQRKAAANVFQYLVTPFGNKIAYPVLDLVELTKLSERQLKFLLEKLSSPKRRILRPVASSPSQLGVKRYEIFHDVLAQPILDWRKQYFVDEEKHRRNLAIKEGLPAQSLRQRYSDEKAALLARQAYLFYKRERNKVFYQIDDALGKALSKKYFSNILLGHESEITAITFNPMNSQMLASADRKGNIKLWDLRRSPDMRPTRTLKSQNGSVNALAFSPDGNKLASGGSDCKVRLWWDLDESKILSRIVGSHDKSVNLVVFNWNGKILVSGSDDHMIKFWNPDNQSVNKPQATLPSQILWFPFVIKEGLLRIILRQKFLFKWIIGGIVKSQGDLQHLDTLLDALPEILKGYREHIHSVAFNSDAQMLALGTKDQIVYLWKINTFDNKPTILNLGHDSQISAVAFSPDNQILASGSWDKTIRLWHLNPSEASPKILGRHKDNVISVAVSPNGRWLASGSWDNTVLLWDLTKSKPKPQVLKAKEHKDEEDKVLAVAFDQNSQMLASASSDKIIRLWNLPNFEQNPKELIGHINAVSSVAFSPDGRWLVSGSWQKDQDSENDENDDRTVRLWDLKLLKETKKTVGKILWRHKKSVTSVAFSPDGKMLASGSDEGIIQLLDLRQAEDLSWDVIYEQSSYNFPEDLVLCPRIANLVTQHKGRFISIKDHQARVWSVAFSPKNNRLASGSDDQTIRLWDFSQIDKEPKAIDITFKDHHFWVGSVAFSPDGQKLASGSYDKNIRVWDLNHLNEEPIVLRGHEQSVTSVAFYPDGKKLVSGSYDNTIREWIVDTEILSDMVCNQVLCNLTQEEWDWFMGKDIPYERTCPNLPPGEGEEAKPAQEVSELKRDFRDKLDQLFAGQKDILDFIEKKTAQQSDISEEDVTNFQNKSKGDRGIFYQLDTLRLLGFLEITDEDKKSGTKRYSFSPRYKKYLSIK
ncbi:MAG: hypothetical protein AB4372_10280 [Xenococcus sp. (in: cyanobacteria)]